MRGLHKSAGRPVGERLGDERIVRGPLVAHGDQHGRREAEPDERARAIGERGAGDAQRLALERGDEDAGPLGMGLGADAQHQAFPLRCRTRTMAPVLGSNRLVEAIGSGSCLGVNGTHSVPS